jgi:hypothetical protein
MTRHPDPPPFAARLVAAHRLLAAGPAIADELGMLPLHQLDQLAAAGRDARAHTHRVGVVMRAFEPDRHWRHRSIRDPASETTAILLAAIMGCTEICIHLRRGGPQPALVLLPLRRIVCARCAQTVRRPDPSESDRCDVCGARGVVVFHPFAAQRGPVIVSGDACPSCAGVLGIRIEEPA